MVDRQVGDGEGPFDGGVIGPAVQCQVRLEAALLDACHKVADLQPPEGGQEASRQRRGTQLDRMPKDARHGETSAPGAENERSLRQLQFIVEGKLERDVKQQHRTGEITQRRRDSRKRCEVEIHQLAGHVDARRSSLVNRGEFEGKRPGFGDENGLEVDAHGVVVARDDKKGLGRIPGMTAAQVFKGDVGSIEPDMVQPVQGRLGTGVEKPIEKGGFRRCFCQRVGQRIVDGAVDFPDQQDPGPVDRDANRPQLRLDQ